MKTFEEALSKVIVGGVNQQEAVAAAQATIEETNSRYRELIAEATNNPTLKLFCRARIITTAQGMEQPGEVLSSLFCCGLICGIEMEKAEPDEPIGDDPAAYPEFAKIADLKYASRGAKAAARLSRKLDHSMIGHPTGMVLLASIMLTGALLLETDKEGRPPAFDALLQDLLLATTILDNAYAELEERGEI